MIPVPSVWGECVIVTLAEGQQESDAAFRAVKGFMEERRRAAAPVPPMPGMN